VEVTPKVQVEKSLLARVMEELVRSLRNLDLAAPRGEQIVSLVDADPSVEKQLAQQLAVPAHVQFDDGDGTTLMGAALLTEATEAMLQNYNGVLQKETEAMKREQNAPAKPVKRVPFRGLLAAQEAAIRRRSEERRAATAADGSVYLPRQIMDTEHTYCSMRDLGELSRIDIDELAAPRRHEGRFLLVKVATRLSLYASCSFVGVLPSGVALPISIAHFTPDLHLHGEALDACLPIGTTLLICEPYVSPHYLGVGGPITGGRSAMGVRVDTPSDVHVLEDDAPQLAGVTWASAVADVSPTPRLTRWGQDGPLARAARRHLQGTSAASTCVPALPGASRATLRAAIAEFLAAERPGAAWREVLAGELMCLWEPADGVLEACVEDAVLCGEVLMALRAYEAVIERIASAPAAVREAAVVRSLAEAAQVAADVGAVGASDVVLNDMFQATLREAAPRFTYGDYVGPVAVEDIPGAGRGLVLTRDVREGELLLLCRAMGSSYSADVPGMPLLRCNPDTGVTSTTTQVLAATRCIHAVLDRPELATPFLGLTAGPTEPYSRYVGAYPLRWGAELDARRALLAARPRVSARYVNGVLRFNAFGPASTPAAASGRDPMARSTMPHPLPAILNHACLPNVSSVFFGDMVATRALHPLSRGTQIMHQYVQGEEPYQLRQMQLAKHGFTCACGLCVMDAADGAEALRRREELNATALPPLVERSRALFHAPTGSGSDAAAHREIAASLLRLVDDLNATYGAARPALRPDLVDVLHRAARHVQVYDVAAATEVRTCGDELTTAGAARPMRVGRNTGRGSGAACAPRSAPARRAF